MTEERKTVWVACSQLNGIMINLFTRGSDDLGAPRVVRDGVGVRLNGPTGTMGGTNAGAEAEPGLTEVDAMWWARWVEQNRGKNPLLDSGVIRELPGNPTPDPS